MGAGDSGLKTAAGARWLAGLTGVLLLGASALAQSNITESVMANAADTPTLSVTQRHDEFYYGRDGGPITLNVWNSGGSATPPALVTVTNTLPSGVTAREVRGDGWSCSVTPVVCTRSDPLVPGARYPAIEMFVIIAVDAGKTPTNTVTVSGGDVIQGGTHSSLFTVRHFVEMSLRVGESVFGEDFQIAAVLDEPPPIEGLTVRFEHYPGAGEWITVGNVPITDGVAELPLNGNHYSARANLFRAYIRGDDAYGFSGTREHIVHKAEQTLTLAPLPRLTLDTLPMTVQASSSAGLPVTLTSSDDSVFTVSGNTLTVAGAGSATLTASQPGRSWSHNAATPVSQVITVQGVEQRITFAVPGPATFGDTPVALVASSDTGLPITFESSDTNVASISGHNAVIHGAGSAVITARQAGDSRYEPASAMQTLVVAPAAQTLSFAPLDDQRYPGSPFSMALSATSSEGLPVNFVVESGPAQLDGNNLTITGPGRVTVAATQAGTTNYQPASITRTFTVTTAADAEWTVSQCGNAGEGALAALLPDVVAGNTIRFSPGLVCREATAIRPGSELLLTGLTVDGAGAEIEINGAGSHRLIRVESGSAVLRHLLLKDGYTADSGAGLLVSDSDVTLENVRLRNNHAGENGGAVAAIGLRAGPLSLHNVVATGNSAARGGAIWIAEPAPSAGAVYPTELTNITLAGNSAGLLGGGIAYHDARLDDPTHPAGPGVGLRLRHATMIGNQAPQASALYMNAPLAGLELANSIIAGGDDIDPAELLHGLPADADIRDSLISDGGYGGQDGDPLLAPVADEQGALAYYALLPGSAAIGACSTVPGIADQRGVPRVDRCDAGAIQSQGFTLTLLGGDQQQTPIGAGFSAPLAVSVTSAVGEPVAGGHLEFVAPASGASLHPPVQRVTIDADGRAALHAVANGVVGSYQVTANASGVTQAQDFSLENQQLATDLALTNSGPVSQGSTFSVFAEALTSGALPDGGIDFEVYRDGAWAAVGTIALDAGVARIDLVASGSDGNLLLRARFPGSATHLASAWQQTVVIVYPPLSVTDPDGGGLVPGDSRTVRIGGGEGAAYAIDVRGPDSFRVLDALACGLASCDYSFTVPATGAFAGVYDISVTDQGTGWQQTLSVQVPLHVTVSRPQLLSGDPLRNHTLITVSGATAGSPITVHPDVATSLALASGTELAGDASAQGNPALFDLSVLDDLPASRDVQLTASSGSLPEGIATLRAEQSVHYQGTVTGPVGEPIAGASVTLLRGAAGDPMLPLEDDQGRFLASTDALGAFALIAPGSVVGAEDALEISAVDYRTLVTPVAPCLTPCPLVMEASHDAETPRFTPPAGVYAGGVQVRLESTTLDARLRYTTDGSTPTATHGTDVANNTHLLLTENTLLKVVAYRAGLNVSPVAEADYRITSATLKSGSGGVIGGLMLGLLGLLGWRRWR